MNGSDINLISIFMVYSSLCLQCFDVINWVSRKACGLLKFLFQQLLKVSQWRPEQILNNEVKQKMSVCVATSLLLRINVASYKQNININFSIL